VCLPFDIETSHIIKTPLVDNMYYGIVENVENTHTHTHTHTHTAVDVLCVGVTLTAYGEQVEDVCGVCEYLCEL